MSEVLTQSEINQLLTAISTVDLGDDEQAFSPTYEIERTMRDLFEVALDEKCSKETSIDMMSCIRRLSGVLHHLRENEK